MEVPSNNLSPRDEALFRAIISKCKAEPIEDENELWQELLTVEERSNKNRIKNRLFKTTERYLAMRQLEKTSPLWNLLLLRWYAENNIRKTARSLLNRIIPALSKERTNNIEYPLYLSWMYEIELFHERDRRRRDEKVILAEQSLDEYYACQKLRFLCEKANRNKIVNDYPEKEDFVREAQRLAESSNSSLVSAFYCVFRLISEDSREGFHELEMLIKEEKIHSKYLIEFYLHAMNFCLRKSNQGDISYAEKYHGFIRSLEAKEMLLDHGVIGFNRLKTAITNGIMVGKLDWAEDFMKRYAGCLPNPNSGHTKDFLSMNQAIIDFHKGNLEACLENIGSFRNSSLYHKDRYNKITCDKLLLKVYYEMGDMDAVESQLASIKNYITTRTDLKKERKDLYLAIFPFLEYMLANEGKIPDYDREKLLISDLQWLEKIEKQSGH